MLVGLSASFAHDQNGMTRADMEATKRVADRLDEVIIFRSTGPWSKRWLEDGYPSKNFHVKGKSSDWGPHAGLVPYDGVYSKVGYDPAKAAKGTAANADGKKSGFASAKPLILTEAQINRQLTLGEGNPKRTAIESVTKVPNSNDLLLFARRSGDQKVIAFRAFAQGGDQFEIKVYPPGVLIANALLILDKDPKGAKAVTFEVMNSDEIGAGMPMTGDYDLFSICPSWAQYGSLAPHDIVKPGIQNATGALHKGMAFRAGQGMDNVLDPSLSTMSRRGDAAHLKQEFKARITQGAGHGGMLSEDKSRLYFGNAPTSEHGDMGNLTPRILRCINELNVAMGAAGEKAALRRVHHNAESHRNRAFGALTKKDMETKKDGDSYGDGFPLTVFQPARLYSGTALAGENMLGTWRYRDVSTLENLAEFNEYAKVLKAAGYYVPKNWIWG